MTSANRFSALNFLDSDSDSDSDSADDSEQYSTTAVAPDTQPDTSGDRAYAEKLALHVRPPSQFHIFCFSNLRFVKVLLHDEIHGVYLCCSPRATARGMRHCRIIISGKRSR